MTEATWSRPVIHAVPDEGLANASYLVELGDGDAMVIDPVRDPSPYLALARRHGLRLRYGVETHLHADFVSGGRELAALGAEVVAARAANLGFAHRGLADGDELAAGGLTLRALATPGHAPEHLAFLLLDGSRALALFSGGALLAGGVARTDLVADDATEALTRAAWRSLHERLLPLPEGLAVYPTHGGASFCSAGASAGPARPTTVGAERAGNPLLAAGLDEDGFVAALLGGLGTYPAYFRRLRALNRAGPRLLGPADCDLPELGPGQVADLMGAGAILVDARPMAAAAAARPAGALAIALRPSFASWLGWLVPAGARLVALLDPGQDAAELVRQCHAIGYDGLAGRLAGGVAAWAAAGLALERTELVGPDRLGDGPVVDVRQAGEVAVGTVPGALAVELGTLTGPGAAERLPGGPLTVLCAAGPRSVTAASVLARAGRRDVRVLRGGYTGWRSWAAGPVRS